MPGRIARVNDRVCFRGFALYLSQNPGQHGDRECRNDAKGNLANRVLADGGGKLVQPLNIDEGALDCLMKAPCLHRRQNTASLPHKQRKSKRGLQLMNQACDAWL